MDVTAAAEEFLDEEQEKSLSAFWVYCQPVQLYTVLAGRQQRSVRALRLSEKLREVLTSLLGDRPGSVQKGCVDLNQ